MNQMNQDEQLHEITRRYKVATTRRRPSKLEGAVRQYIEQRVEPLQERFGSVADIWLKLVPEELSGHCSVAAISGKELVVVADGPSYLYQLRLIGDELLRELRSCCPRARFDRIKFKVGLPSQPAERMHQGVNK